jgi:hypothetical protein
MRLTQCSPLPGPGLLARAGELAVLCASAEDTAELLLTAINEVAGAGGDGSDLVRRVARAALDQARPPSWACAGVTSAGAIAVLVHGEATALVTAGSEPVTVSAVAAVTPVSRLFTGSQVTVVLTLPGHGDPDSRLRLAVLTEPLVPPAVATASMQTPPAWMTPSSSRSRLSGSP